MKKLTPKQAFEHLKAMDPGVTEIRPGETAEGSKTMHVECTTASGIDWLSVMPGANIDWRTYQKWPEEPGTWRAPVLPGDAGKECRVRDFVVDKWQTVTLSGYSNLQGNYCWIDDTETGWAFCEVFEPAPIRPARKARTRASKKTRKSAR